MSGRAVAIKPASLRTVAVAMTALVLAGPATLAQAPPAPADPPLGRGHLWLKLGRVDLDHDATAEWGVDREGYWALEGYGGGSGYYFGGELGRARAGHAVTADGDSIRDFDFLSAELNGKWAFDLGHGFSFDAGVGSAVFYVDGERVVVLNGEELSTNLGDFGFGAQIFVDATWRARRLLIGADVKYQWAFDLLSFDYSNFRFGGHLGLAF